MKPGQYRSNTVTSTYVDFGDKHVDNAADHRNEVKYVPRVFEIILHTRATHTDREKYRQVDVCTVVIVNIQYLRMNV